MHWKIMKNSQIRIMGCATMWHENTEEIEVIFSLCLHVLIVAAAAVLIVVIVFVVVVVVDHPPGDAWVHLPHRRGLLGQVQLQLIFEIFFKGNLP